MDKSWDFLSSLSAIKITICCVIAARITSTLRETVFLNFVYPMPIANNNGKSEFAYSINLTKSFFLIIYLNVLFYMIYYKNGTLILWPLGDFSS